MMMMNVRQINDLDVFDVLFLHLCVLGDDDDRRKNV